MTDREAALTAALSDLLDLIETIDGGEHDDEPALANARALLES